MTNAAVLANPVAPLTADREPDFANMEAVLRKEAPSRPTLFEFFLNMPLFESIVPEAVLAVESDLRDARICIHAWRALGYDYITYGAFAFTGFDFPAGKVAHANTKSLNDGAVITDRESFERYAWKDPDGDYSQLDVIGNELPDGMKIISQGPCGVLENVINLVGYDNLCFMLIDDPDLAHDIFAGVGSRLARYYELIAPHPAIGACIGNDDWGFKTQTMLSPDQMREYVFPWHKKIVENIHKAGKPAILHSCGYFGEIADDIVDIGYDGRHSYEDNILPVEKAYEQYRDHFAILGGIDVDFICRATPDEVYKRSRALIEQTRTHGSFGLGTGNSVPEYVPRENYFAMIRAALEG